MINSTKVIKFTRKIDCDIAFFWSKLGHFVFQFVSMLTITQSLGCVDVTIFVDVAPNMACRPDALW